MRKTHQNDHPQIFSKNQEKNGRRTPDVYSEQ